MRLFEICILYSKIRLGQQHKGFFEGFLIQLVSTKLYWRIWDVYQIKHADEADT